MDEMLTRLWERELWTAREAIKHADDYLERADMYQLGDYTMLLSLCQSLTAHVRSMATLAEAYKEMSQ